jgi:hypothetical protein
VKQSCSKEELGKRIDTLPVEWNGKAEIIVMEMGKQ